MDFAAKLGELAEGRGMSQRDVAAVAGVSHTTSNRWFAGKGLPDIRQATALARHFGVPLDFLADDRATEPPDPAEAELIRLARRVGVQVAIDRVIAVPPSPQPSPPPGRRYVHSEPATSPAPRQRRKPG